MKLNKAETIEKDDRYTLAFHIKSVYNDILFIQMQIWLQELTWRAYLMYPTWV